MIMTNPIVKFDSVEKTYPGTPLPVLQVPELSIQQGEFFSLLGPSGSGKTTALRLMAGFEIADKGSIWLGNENVTHTQPFNRNINTVFQSYALFPHMRMWDNVAYPLKMAGIKGPERRKRVDEALELVGMTSMADRYPHQVSGGQRQRVALARAFVGRPKVLLLDEPLSALDLNLRQQMQHLLVDLQRQIGITFVYVTHDQGEALSMSDRVAVMKGGEIEQLDTPNNIYYKPKSKFIAQFIGKSNILSGHATCTENGGSVLACGETFSVPSLKQSGNVQFALRFESLKITPVTEPRPQGASFKGRVSDVLFMGNCCEVKVACQGQDLIAFVPGRREMMPNPNSEVYVSFNPDECPVFHE